MKNNRIIKAKTKKEKGFVFSLEAVIALLLFGLIVLSFIPTKEVTLKELAIVQQQNDLIKVWSAKYPSEQEIINDTKQLLGRGTRITINGRVVFGETITGKKAVSSEGIIVDPLLIENKYIITTYFD